tara:strand:+ start:625 stop:1443 length:819 start_codon:yes stop_codon:yes gene_type:complete
MKFSAIIEARMMSRRLPGKVLKRIEGKEVLKIIIERLKLSKKLNNIVVATTTNKKDDKIVSFLKKMNISYYRGSNTSIVDRIINCAQKFNIDYACRVTADNPLTDYSIIDYMINNFEKSKKLDFTTNNYFGSNQKRKIAYGLDINLFSIKSLKKVKKFSKKNKIFLEYPSLYYSLYYEYFNTQKKSTFNIKNVNLPKNLILSKKYRLTIDSPRDLIFFKKIFNEYFKLNQTDDYIYLPKLKKLLRKKPELAKINSDIAHYNAASDLLKKQSA